jgi:hypothetical protein
MAKFLVTRLFKKKPMQAKNVLVYYFAFIFDKRKIPFFFICKVFRLMRMEKHLLEEIN